MRKELCIICTMQLLTTNWTLAMPFGRSAAIYRIVGRIAFMNFW